MSINVTRLEEVVYVNTTADGTVYVTKISNNEGNPAIQFQDEGANIGTAGAVNTIDFVGSAVSLAMVGGKLTVTITGGGGSAAWGSITGTITNQSDLITLLSNYLTTSAAASGYQPLDSDLTAIAALTTTSFGRSLLELANAAALLSASGGIGSSSVVGLQDLYIPAVAMWPRTTGGCAALAKTEMATSLVNIQSLDFDQTTSEYAQFTISLPKNWNNGTVTATFYWTAASGSGDVTWGIQGGAYSNDDALTTALGSAQTVTDTLIAANDLHITSATSAITLAGTPADADFLAFQIYRDISDTLSADAKLLGVVIQLTTDAAISS